MKLFTGKRLKCIENFGDFSKGEKFTVEKVTDKYCKIQGNKLTLETINKHFKGLKPKNKEIKTEDKKKRVLFPWMKNETGQRYKTMLALLADKKGWDKVISGEVSYNKRLLTIVKRTNEYFPDMFKIVSEFYSSKGRTLTEKEFTPIAMGRITMMFRYDKEKKEVLQMPEHPLKCGGKLDSALKYCQNLLKEK